MVDVAVDLSRIEAAAEARLGAFRAMRARHDLSAFEYCTTVRIIPFAMSCGHPVTTLSARDLGETDLMAPYLHEQMPRYATWIERSAPEACGAMMHDLDQRCPTIPTGFPEGAPDRESGLLHLIVNLPEIEALTRIRDHKVAVAQAKAHGRYRWLCGWGLRD